MRRKKKTSDVRTIDLRSGGTVTVELNASAFDLMGRDRDFVTELVDLVQSYAETGSGKESASSRTTPSKVRAARGKSRKDAEPEPEAESVAESA